MDFLHLCRQQRLVLSVFTVIPRHLSLWNITASFPRKLPIWRYLLQTLCLQQAEQPVAGIDFIKERGAKKITFLCILAAPEGVKKLQEAHPDVDIYAAAYDSNGLNDHGYIVPGLGDAGDRIFGTK